MTAIILLAFALFFCGFCWATERYTPLVSFGVLLVVLSLARLV